MYHRTFLKLPQLMASITGLEKKYKRIRWSNISKVKMDLPLFVVFLNFAEMFWSIYLRTYQWANTNWSTSEIKTKFSEADFDQLGEWRLRQISKQKYSLLPLRFLFFFDDKKVVKTLFTQAKRSFSRQSPPG